MSVEISGDLVGLEQANAELDKLIAADAQSAQSPAAPDSADKSASGGTRAAQPAE